MTFVKAVLEVAVEYDTDRESVDGREIVRELRRVLAKANTGFRVSDATVLRWIAETE